MDPTSKAVIEQTLLEIASGCRTLAPSLELENALLEAGYVIAPVEPSSIMAMRGYQASPVFEGSDGVFDYITLEEAPHVPGFTYERKFDDEERGHLVAAAAYRGAIRGYQEWNRRRENGEDQRFIDSWAEPVKNTVERCKAIAVTNGDRA
jgi:hypothetical protein